MTAQELFYKMLEENEESTSTEMRIEFAKYHAIEIIKKLSKTEAEYQNNINYVYPLKNIK